MWSKEEADAAAMEAQAVSMEIAEEVARGLGDDDTIGTRIKRAASTTNNYIHVCSLMYLRLYLMFTSNPRFGWKSSFLWTSHSWECS